MKREGNLWPQLVSWENLLLAFRQAIRGKRKRPDVAGFILDWEPLLLELKRELQSGQYVPGGYRTFRVWEPKPRWISAAPFRDRVVHHALTQIIEPIFQRRFSPHSYASRKGLGTHKAIDSATRACRRRGFVLQCDIRKYFPSIDHSILEDLLSRVIKCKPTLDLAWRIIDSSNLEDVLLVYFPGDDLFTPCDRRRGLPLGNQTSQFFANVYLNELDQFVLREIRPAAYCRYVDDFLVFDDDPDVLWDARRRIEMKLDSLRLRLHEGKSRVYRTSSGITFLGWRIFPDHRRLVRGNVVRFRRRMRWLQRRFAEGAMGWKEVQARLQSWNAHAAHGDTWRLREQIFEQFPFSWRRDDES